MFHINCMMMIRTVLSFPDDHEAQGLSEHPYYYLILFDFFQYVIWYSSFLKYSSKRIQSGDMQNQTDYKIIQKQMIEQLKISNKTIFLQGMSLKASFTITNPNQQIALGYEIQALQLYKSQDNENPDTTASITSILSIFPKNGLLLRQQSQKIVIKARNKQEFDCDGFLQSNAKIYVKYTLNNNFNRILAKNKKLQHLGLTEDNIQKYEGISMISVQVGTDYIRLKDEIQKQVLLSSSLGKQTLNISNIVSKQQLKARLNDQDCSDICTLVNSLQLNSKIKVENCQKVNIQKSKPSQQEINSLKLQSRKSIQQIEQVQNNEQMNKFNSFCMQSAKENSFSKHSNTNSNSNSKGQMKECSGEVSVGSVIGAGKYQFSSYQIAILAILAGLFYSLGSFCNKIVNTNLV